MNNKTFLCGLLVGSAIGASMSLLFTPVSGKDLRQQVKTSKGEWIRIANDLKENAVDIKDSVAKLSKESKEIIKDLASDLKTAVDEWQRDIEPNKITLQEEMNEIQMTIAKLEKKLQDERFKA